MAIAVCSLVLRELVLPPTALISLKSFANAALAGAAGPANGNWAALCIMKGLTLRQWGSTGAAFIGGVD